MDANNFSNKLAVRNIRPAPAKQCHGVVDYVLCMQILINASLKRLKFIRSTVYNALSEDFVKS